MRKLVKFVGGELYSAYFKIACEICEKQGNLDEASRYLGQCKSIAKRIGIQDLQIIYK